VRELADIESSFPIPRLRAPLLPREPIGVEALRALSREVFGDADPAQLFTRSRPIRLEKRGDRTWLEIDLPNAASEDVEVLARGSELIVRVRDAHRRVSLPASLAGRSVEGARLTKGVLEICFAP